MHFKKKFITAIATGSLLLNALTPFAFASTSIEISGNGSSSDNSTDLKTTQTTTVVQNNNADIKNKVESKAQTGENQANDNTGGSVTIETGKAKSIVDISNQANLNKAIVNNCGTCNGSTDVLISGNGSDSKNEAELSNKNEVSVYQDNKAKFNNDVESKAKTGKNEANRNTGGDVTIKTGKALAGAIISNAANANLAIISGNNNGTSKTVDAKIIGNGSGSKNEIELKLERSATLVQDNNADIKNKVEAQAKTGENEANDNTGGHVSVKTGDANAIVSVDNMANFNAASIDCCVLDLKAKISGNGSDSKNKIEAELENELKVFQGGEKGNKANFDNNVEAKAQTGDNEVNRNTDPVKDPSITTGNSDSETSVSNSANANIFGPSIDLPGGLNFDFSFNLNDLLVHMFS